MEVGLARVGCGRARAYARRHRVAGRAARAVLPPPPSATVATMVRRVGLGDPVTGGRHPMTEDEHAARLDRHAAWLTGWDAWVDHTLSRCVLSAGELEGRRHGLRQLALAPAVYLSAWRCRLCWIAFWKSEALRQSWLFRDFWLLEPRLDPRPNDCQCARRWHCLARVEDESESESDAGSDPEWGALSFLVCRSLKHTQQNA